MTDTITFDGYSEVVITGGTSSITNYFSVAGQRVAMRKGAILSYLLPDFLGSSSVALNNDGSVQEVQLFAPYGSFWTMDKRKVGISDIKILLLRLYHEMRNQMRVK